MVEKRFHITDPINNKASVKITNKYHRHTLNIKTRGTDPVVTYKYWKYHIRNFFSYVAVSLGSDDDCCFGQTRVIVYRKMNRIWKKVYIYIIRFRQKDIMIIRIAIFVHVKFRRVDEICESHAVYILHFGVFTIASELLKFGTKQKPCRPRRRNNFHLKTYICALLYRVYKGKESFSVLWRVSKALRENTIIMPGNPLML